MQTRKYPRTMQEAFGPYTSNQLVERNSSDYGWAWWAAIVVVSVVSLIVIAVGVPA